MCLKAGMVGWVESLMNSLADCECFRQLGEW